MKALKFLFWVITVIITIETLNYIFRLGFHGKNAATQYLLEELHFLKANVLIFGSFLAAYLLIYFIRYTLKS